MEPINAEGNPPRVSIIIPTHNSARTLGVVLNSLTNFCYDKKKIELIIVDDGSTDETPNLIKEFENSRREIFNSIKVVLRRQNRGTSYTRNEGLRMASEDLIFTLDSDVMLRETTLNDLVELTKSESNIGAVCSVYLTENPSLKEIILAGKYLGKIRDGDLFTGAALIKRSVVESVGFFNESLGYPKYPNEDVEYKLRMNKLGYRVLVDGRKPLLHIKNGAINRMKVSTLKSLAQQVKTYLSQEYGYVIYQFFRVAPFPWKLEWLLYASATWTLLILLLVKPLMALFTLLLALIGSILCFKTIIYNIKIKIRIVAGPVILISRLIRSFTLSIVIFKLCLNHFLDIHACA